MADPRRPSSTSDDLHEIIRSLGRLEEGQERMRADFDAEKVDTRDSRGRMHAKLEKIDGTVAIVGQVAAQARDRAESAHKMIVEDVKPVTDEIKEMRKLGRSTLVAVAFVAGGLGITVANFGESVINWARAVLRIT
jgi:hypothetical protein